MFLNFLTISLIHIINAKPYHIPKNINFNINYFNDTNCSLIYKITEIKSICNKNINSCCQTILNDISINNSFNTCNFINDPKSNVNSIQYRCSKDSINNLNATEYFAYIGFFSIILIGVILTIKFLMCLWKKCFVSDYSII